MKPEEIDKLFKERLGDLPIPPAADNWARLQNKMEPPKKAHSLWVYYVAASVVILMVAGLLVYRNIYPAPDVTIAQIGSEQPNAILPEKIIPPRATPMGPPASTKENIAVTENVPAKPELVLPLKKEPEAINATIAKEAPVAGAKKITRKNQVNKVPPPGLAPEVTPEIMIAKQNNTEPAADKMIVTTIKPAVSAGVQILVKIDDLAEQAEVNLAETTFRENLSRKGALLKNLYKQARNLKNGEEVELAALGLDTEKINAEKEIIKQKINKVISL